MNNYDIKSKKRNNQVQCFHLTKRVLAASAVASLLLFAIAPIQVMGLANEETINATQDEEADITKNILEEVQLLTDVKISANLSNLAESANLALGLTGIGRVDDELLMPERVVAFYIPDLAGMMQPKGPADVRIEPLPITLADFPELDELIGGLNGAVTEIVQDLITEVYTVINETSLEGAVSVEGVDALVTALDNLNNIDTSLESLSVYDDQVEVMIMAEGAVIIDFTEGFRNHLEVAINNVVIDAVNDVFNAVDGLDVKLLSDRPENELLFNDLVLNSIVTPLKSAIIDAADLIIEGLTDGTIDFPLVLQKIQLIGNVSVEANVLVDNPESINNETAIYGAGLSTTNIDEQLLSSFIDKATVIVEETEEDIDSNSDLEPETDEEAEEDINSESDSDNENEVDDDPDLDSDLDMEDDDNEDDDLDPDNNKDGDDDTDNDSALDNDLNPNDDGDETDTLETPTYDTIYENDLKITGKGTPGLTVTAKVDDTVIGTAIVSSGDDSYLISLKETMSANTIVELHQADKNGNKSKSVYARVQAVNDQTGGSNFPNDANANGGSGFPNDNNDNGRPGSIGSNNNEPKTKQFPGNVLPKTATPMFNWMMSGLVVMIAGVTGLLLRRKKA